MVMVMVMTPYLFLVPHLSDGDDSIYVCYRPIFRLRCWTVHPNLKGERIGLAVFTKIPV